MSEGALQRQPHSMPQLRVVGGPMDGKRFPITSRKITIGRSSENDIVLKHDSKCSRQHAVLRSTSQGYSIESLNPNNPVCVNTQPVGTAILLPGVQISIGETEIVFEVPARQSTDMAIPEAPGQFAPVKPRNSSPSRSKKRPSSRRNQSNQQSPMFKIIIGVVVIGTIYLLTTESKKPGAPTAITQSKDIEAEIKAAQKIQQDKELAARKSNKTTAQYREAQSAYLKGFRDYEKGLYGRAKDSFQTCLTLFPDHVLCKRYYGLSNRKMDEIVQYNLRLGKDHRERNQYRACMSAMRNVLVMVRNKSDKRYQQAKAHFDACQTLLGDGL